MSIVRIDYINCRLYKLYCRMNFCSILQLIYWDDKNFYLEHEFISLTDGFIRAVILSKQTATGLKVPVSEIIAEVEPNAQRPEITKDLELWLNSMEVSSQRYKKQRWTKAILVFFFFFYFLFHCYFIIIYNIVGPYIRRAKVWNYYSWNNFFFFFKKTRKEIKLFWEKVAKHIWQAYRRKTFDRWYQISDIFSYVISDNKDIKQIFFLQLINVM